MAHRIYLIALIIIFLQTDCEEFKIEFNMFSAVAIGDLNNDGLPDIAACFTYIEASSPHPGYVAVYLQNPAQAGTFFQADVYFTGNDPVSIDIGDLNGDNRLDLVTANNTGGSGVSVLLQDPAFSGKFLPVTNYKTGKYASWVSIGDLNGDGKNDIVVADTVISMLFQNPGTPGMFLPTEATGVKAYSVRIADLNGDQKPDIVAASWFEGVVLVMAHDPGNNGFFLPPSRYVAGERPVSLAVGDLDGNKKPDLAVSLHGTDNGSGSGVAVLVQDPSAAGNFLLSMHYETDIRPEDVSISDLNGDGLPDLIVSNSGALAGTCPPDCNSSWSSVSILLQYPASPAYFQAAVNYPPSSGFITGVSVGDINGDNKPDLIVAQTDGIVIRLQDEANAGQFLSAVPVPPVPLYN